MKTIIQLKMIASTLLSTVTRILVCHILLSAVGLFVSATHTKHAAQI